MSDINCPYCGAEQDINHDDDYGIAEDEVYEQECSECEKIFAFNTGFILVYEAWKADCLNGAEHKYKRTDTYPREFTKMRCTDCHHERKCTDDELA